MKLELHVRSTAVIHKDLRRSFRFNALAKIPRIPAIAPTPKSPAAGEKTRQQNFCQKTFEKPIDATTAFVVYAPHRMGV
ncbi:hypothetical protein [Ensifer sp. MJa1]|uniref:hypothetical protein n=1 Tax=Ensifer sp. MJa1 TaxID=2919888 RepID=UPI00300B5508